MFAPQFESLRSQPRRQRAWRDVAQSSYPKLWDGTPYDPPQRALREAQLAYLYALARGMMPRDQAESAELDRELAHPDLPAAYTYFAQTAAHDLSWHRYVREPWREGRALPPRVAELVNRHRPCLDLQVLYGPGQLDMPWLYERGDPELLRVEKRAYGDKFEWDLVRDDQQRALLADPRQDETVMVSQLHATLIRVHNLLVAALRKLGHDSARPPTSFDAARAILTWHYQWLVVNDLLPRILDTRRATALQLCLRDLASGRPVSLSVFGSAEPFMPAEFPFAILRFGHALVRERYRVNRSLYEQPLTPERWPPPGRAPGGGFLTLFRKLPAGWGIDWNLFVPTARDEHQVARRIGPHVCWSHGNLPMLAGDDPRRALLPFLTLRAGWEEPLRFVDGQAAAKRHVAMPVVPAAAGAERDPLWHYVLREAEVQQRGARLGALGSTVTWQVLVGVLRTDPDSYLSCASAWRPFLGERAGEFSLAELVFLPDADVDVVAERVRAGLAAGAALPPA